MTDQEVFAMSDKEFENCEREIFHLLGDVRLEAESSSDERIESILKRAKIDCVAKDSTEFIVEGMGRGLLGITDALVGMTEKKQKPRKRSF